MLALAFTSLGMKEAAAGVDWDGKSYAATAFRKIGGCRCTDMIQKYRRSVKTV